MPVTDTLIDALRRLAIATLAYAAAIALAASCLLPTLLSVQSVARLAPTQAHPVVARSPQAAPPAPLGAVL